VTGAAASDPGFNSLGAGRVATACADSRAAACRQGQWRRLRPAWPPIPGGDQV